MNFNKETMIFRVHIPKSIIGIGAADSLVDIIKGEKAKKVLIVTDKSIVDKNIILSMKNTLATEGIGFVIYDNCQPDAPLNIIEECRQTAKKDNYDMVVGVGGGSVMDTAKVVSASINSDRSIYDLVGFDKITTPGLPLILFPTTAGTGSEWSAIAAAKDEKSGEKTGFFGKAMWASTVVIDPLLTQDLPQRLTADGGMDTLSHAIEPYVSWKANIVSDMFAEKVIQLVSENLRSAYTNGPKQLEARLNMAVAAPLGMQAVQSAAGAGMVHGMGYILAIMKHLSHGLSCSLMLPFVMEFNLTSNLQKFARIAELMGEQTSGLSLMDKAKKSVDAVRRLSKDVDMPQSLAEVGIEKKDIPEMVDYLFSGRVLESRGLAANARYMTREDAKRILEAAISYK